MKLPICLVCLKSGILCPSCQEKFDRGEITPLDIEVARHFLEIEKREDAGKILENYIFIEMKDVFEQIKYWRTTGKAEIDLIGIKNQKIYPIEIKSHQRKIERSFMSFLEKYNVKRGIVFSLGKVEERKIGKSKILFVPHFLV